MNHTIRCKSCGRFLSLERGNYSVEYTPDTHFTSEKIEYMCDDCKLSEVIHNAIRKTLFELEELELTNKDKYEIEKKVSRYVKEAIRQ